MSVVLQYKLSRLEDMLFFTLHCVTASCVRRLCYEEDDDDAVVSDDALSHQLVIR